MKEIVFDYKCIEIVFEMEIVVRNKLWDVRYNLVYFYVYSYFGKKLMSIDVCVLILELVGVI